MSSIPKETVFVMSLPRSGTHFIWSRLVESGQYQLIYDADRVPALDVLSKHYTGKLDLLYPAPKNPNYNFQYNSLKEVKESMTATEHLAWLRSKYGAVDNFDLFRRSMECQDCGEKTLFSVNRFIYTSCNELFGGPSFEWTNDYALEAFRLLRGWAEKLSRPSRFVLVVRDVRQWVRSQRLMYGESKLGMLTKRVRGMPDLIRAYSSLDVPIYDMNSVINSMKQGAPEFWVNVEPLSKEEIEKRAEEAISILNENVNKCGSEKPALLRPRRMIEYLAEKDPIRRTSLVRSIGLLPIRIARRFPWMCPMIASDFEGEALDNAKIDLSALAQQRDGV